MFFDCGILVLRLREKTNRNYTTREVNKMKKNTAKMYAVAYRWADSNEVDLCKADARTLACMYADDNIIILSTMEL